MPARHAYRCNGRFASGKGSRVPRARPSGNANKGARAEQTARRTRIQAANSEKILAAALDVFARDGFRGATIDRIAEAAGMSKPNLLHY